MVKNCKTLLARQRPRALLVATNPAPDSDPGSVPVELAKNVEAGLEPAPTCHAVDWR